MTVLQYADKSIADKINDLSAITTFAIFIAKDTRVLRLYQNT
jgi:hypothetical protein